MKTAALIALTAMAGAAFAGDPIQINEFAPNPDGGDPATVDFEIRGTAGAMFDGWVYGIESDGTSSVGTIDRATFVSGMFDTNGILNVQIADFENPSFTVVLASAQLGTGTDIDADNDGIVDDASIFGTVYDALGVPDTTGETLYGANLGGTDFMFTGSEPERVFRESTTGTWIAVNSVDFDDGIFGADGTEYFVSSFVSDPNLYNYGEVNQAFIPAPGAVALVGLGGFVAARRRRA